MPLMSEEHTKVSVIVDDGKAWPVEKGTESAYITKISSPLETGTFDYSWRPPPQEESKAAPEAKNVVEEEAMEGIETKEDGETAQEKVPVTKRHWRR